jgi:hypothetical protein
MAVNSQSVRDFVAAMASGDKSLKHADTTEVDAAKMRHSDMIAQLNHHVRQMSYAPSAAQKMHHLGQIQQIAKAGEADVHLATTGSVQTRPYDY